MNPTQLRRLLVTALALVAAACLAGVATAQDPGATGTPGQQQGASAPDFSSSDLDSFVDAQNKVEDIGVKYQEKVRGAEPNEMGAIREEMNQEMVEAVRSSGLDVGTYNEIANAAQSDPSLAEKIQGMRDE